MRTRLVRGEIAPHLRLRELKYLRLGLGMACRVQLSLQLRPANTAEPVCESRIRVGRHLRTLCVSVSTSRLMEQSFDI